MRIPCPYCGARDAHEFAYLGDATLTRPELVTPDSPAAPDAAARFHDYVYQRANPAGAHEEWWYHAQGCRQWVKVARDTRTHAIGGASLARDTATAGEPA